MAINYLDGYLHAIGICRIEGIVQVQDSDSCKVDINFQGGELTIAVPQKWVKDDRGVFLFHEEDMAFVNIRLGIQSTNKTFNGNTYSKIDIAIKRVIEFRRLNSEESKAV